VFINLVHRTSLSFVFIFSKVIDGVVVIFLFLPESKVFLEEFDDALGVTEVILLELVDLVEGILEGLVGKCDGFLGVLLGLVVEHREVEGEAELDGIAGRKADVHGLLVGLEGGVLGGVEVGALGVLSLVAVVVTDHLDEEALGLPVAGFAEDVLVDDINDTLAVLHELLLDDALVSGEGILELGVLGVLFDGLDGAAGGPLAGDEVLEGDGEQVALVGGDVGTLLLEDLFEEVDHILKTLGLLGNTGKEDVLFYAHI